MDLVYAAEQVPGGAPGGAWGPFIPLLLIFLVFYFLMIRPQQKKQKEHRQMLEALKTGDQVVTSGGLYGTIVGFGEDNRVILKIADNVKVEVGRAFIAGKAGTPVEPKS